MIQVIICHEIKPQRGHINPSCGATPFASEKCPFKRGGLSSGWSLKRSPTVYVLISLWLCNPIGLYICMSNFLTEINIDVDSGFKRWDWHWLTGPVCQPG